MPFRTLPFRTVIIESDSIGQRTITSVREASELLVSNWPARQRGAAWRAARVAADAALAGTLKTEKAREAFVTATRVAGIFVRED